MFACEVRGGTAPTKTRPKVATAVRPRTGAKLTDLNLVLREFQTGAPPETTDFFSADVVVQRPSADPPLRLRASSAGVTRPKTLKRDQVPTRQRPIVSAQPHWISCGRPPSRQKEAFPCHLTTRRGERRRREDAWTKPRPTTPMKTKAVLKSNQDDDDFFFERGADDKKEQVHDPEADGFAAIEGPCPFRIQVTPECGSPLQLDDLGARAAKPGWCPDDSSVSSGSCTKRRVIRYGLGLDVPVHDDHLDVISTASSFLDDLSPVGGGPSTLDEEDSSFRLETNLGEDFLSLFAPSTTTTTTTTSMMMTTTTQPSSQAQTQRPQQQPTPAAAGQALTQSPVVSSVVVFPRSGFGSN